MDKKHYARGFTLVEVTAAVMLLVIALALAVGGYLFTLKNTNQGDVQNELDIDVQVAMERLKMDLRLSSLDEIFYYPEGPGPYEAISFPMARDSDGDGVVERDNEGNLIWDETVIYHVRPTTPNQLVKTTFSPRDDALTDAQRQNQLDRVVVDGVAERALNGANATSRILFENLLDWEILVQEGTYDAYSPTLTRDKATLGYILLDPGPHKFTFKTVGKNSGSTNSNHYIGIDQLFVSPSQSPREGEAQLPPAEQIGAYARYQYMPVGSWKGKHQLLFPATGTDKQFTLIMRNDRWEETNFGGVGYQTDNTHIEFDELLSPKDYVVHLEGMDTSWEAAAQTGDHTGQNPTNGMTGVAVRVLLKGSSIAENGDWIAYNGTQCQLTFRASDAYPATINDVYIGESSYPETVTPDYEGSNIQRVRFKDAMGTSAYYAHIAANSTRTSEWIDLKIDRDKNYLVAFTAYGILKQWRDERAQPIGTSTPSTALTTWLALDPSGSYTAYDLNQRTDWSGLGTNILQQSKYCIGLESLYVSYADKGTYTSHIFDTHHESPSYGNVAWNFIRPSGTDLSLKVRSGALPDLSDATAWSNITAAAISPITAIPGSWKRYVQFQALMQSNSDGSETPKLKDVTVNWTGAKQMVAIGGIFTRGPDYGIFSIDVDGKPLRAALIVDLEIYKDVRAENNEMRRVTSGLKVELTPRNSGL
jgi:hypothetical protein